MRKFPGRAALALALAAALPACGPVTTVQKAGVDQEITREIRWRMRQDPRDRFGDVWANCIGLKVTLVGRVATPQDAQEAYQIALSLCRGAEVVSQIEVRPR